MFITLLTDFGTADYFVGAMKGVILSANASVPIVDITHNIPPHDIQAAAFTLLAVYEAFPARTIHVAVVDPGVGSARRPILVVAGRQFFVGPDNGLFGYILERESGSRVFHLTRDEYFRQPVSPTFHGRDVFAPVASALSNGIEPAALGDEIEDYVKLAPLAPQRSDAGSLLASIIHIDRFGNCVTNLTHSDLTEEMIERGVRLAVRGREITSIRRFFAEGDSGEDLFAVWGSAGFLEIVAFRASAAQLLDTQVGETVQVERGKDDPLNHTK